MSLTIQQQRAKYALKKVNKLVATLKKDQPKNFVSYSSALPAMIHMNGLGQAMAFCKSKSNASDDKGIAYSALYDIVSEWLCQDMQVYGQHRNVLEGVTQQNMRDYQLAQTETLLLMSWIKKLAKAYFPEEANQ